MPSQINPLTSLRFFAAFAIFYHHLGDYLALATPPHVDFCLTLAVDFFFVLSGYILSHVYLPRFAHSLADTRAFLAARFARIYPAHLFVLVLFVIYVAAGKLAGLGVNAERYQPLSLAYHVLLVNAWGLEPTKTWNYPDWSISAEWAAYLVFPVLALGIGRIGAKTAGGLLCLLLGAFAILDHALNVTSRTVDFSILRVWPEFTLGMLAYRSQPLLARLRVPPNALFAGCLAALAGFVAAGAAAALIVALFTLMVMAAAALSGTTGRVLSHPRLVRLGEESYAFYVVHALVLSAFFSAMKLRAPAAHDPGIAAKAIIAAALSLIAAAAIHRFVEGPARRWLRGGLSGAEAVTAK